MLTRHRWSWPASTPVQRGVASGDDVASPRVMVVDADLSSGTVLCVALAGAGHEVVRGARSQQRLAELPSRSEGLDLTVPVGDAVDGSVILATVEDAVGGLDAIVVPVAAVVGKVKVRSRAVSEAMALAEGICAAAAAQDVPVFLVGVGASAVRAFVEESVSEPGRIVVVEAASDLVLALSGPQASRRRSRWGGRARRLVKRVFEEPSK